jgi:ribosomal protein S18 acetylase RimI-like enzyme
LPTVIVREATESDLPSVAHIKVESWRDTYTGLVPPDTLARFLDEPSQLDYVRAAAARPGTLILVAVEDRGDVIGFSLTYTDRQPDPWLESLHVLAAHRSNGAGATLMRATASRLAALGHRTMQLGVVAGNDRAMRFYERLGAQRTGREPATWAPAVQHEIFRWSDVSVLE